MTNGEKIKTLFPDMYQVEQSLEAWDSWWNAEYIKPTTNDLAVDCVSRTSALDSINWAYNLGDAYQKINDLPSVTPQPRWIPISERLPKDRREVLVTAYWHETYQVMMASYFGDGLWWCVPFNNCGEHMQRLKPKAWMPLPKSYSEVEE